ncbi:aminoglycoside phosphotransferase family protein [Varunaivibrio sulfuroxidans]|uniref:Aminoglycoside phosphotransferase domain-containing protein n=1 Tax=Varunaivibrio sulfuroxidans TaxID=1773489 RepID=A0A4R3J875_9PROT|nr:phosphotransferase [Varunaivibrio sulfuroxidans]TCS61644.1 hypothetical protein EDD55_10753 [Varunaivibrio sulfuroxidans]WES29484.1 phosphotransferase [Varunaivibrio sulfuroxidans]
MPERARALDAFVTRAGWGRASRRPLAGDASFRRYVRLSIDDGTVRDGRPHKRTALVMDAPPPLEDIRPFCRVDRMLLSLGLSAPEILAEDTERGFLLLEDWGDNTYTRLLAAGADETALYALAVDVLIVLRRHPLSPVLSAQLPPYDTRRLLDEAFLLTDWYWPAIFGRPLSPDARAAYEAAWRGALAPALTEPRVLTLRDYHVDNLMRIDGRDGVRACGLLDFQDALAGHPAYDLVSLLQDARRDISPALATAMLARYLDALDIPDRDAFTAAFTILGAQRHAKVIGVFARLCKRDGKTVYLGHIPRLWRLLETALAHPTLAAVAEWFDAYIPPERRLTLLCESEIS